MDKRKGIMAIYAVENEYGTMVFLMALTHLFDVGVQNFTKEYVSTRIEEIKAQEKRDKENGIEKVVAPDFEIDMLNCALELSSIAILDLIRQVKNILS